MRKQIISLVVVAIASAVTVSAETNREDDIRRMQNAAEVLRAIERTPDKAIPDKIMQSAKCIAIIPGEKKVAFFVGGNWGKGLVSCREANGGWSAPLFLSMGGGSFGFQIGGKATDVVFLVMNADGAKKLVQDDVKFGAGVSAAAGPVGRSGTAETDAELHAEILSYSRARGLFAGASLNGAVMKQDKGANEKLYGHQVTARELLIQGNVRTPMAARVLDSTLAKYSPHGGQAFGQA